jgi:predicted dehydrogenase
VDALREGREPLVRPQQALVVQAVSDALYRSAESGREVAVEIPQPAAHA